MGAISSPARWLRSRHACRSRCQRRAARRTRVLPWHAGLGSSSAAIVAGVVLASVVLDLGLHHEPASVSPLPPSSRVIRTTPRPRASAGSRSRCPTVSSVASTRTRI